MLTQFHQFDVDGDGRLTSRDLSQLAAMHLQLATAPRYRDVLDKQRPPKAGHGTRTWANGTWYEGEWKDSRPHGAGRTRWADGSVYEGAHHEGLPHGLGKMTYGTGGASYEGSWLAGRRDGHGVLTNADGTSWQGEWLDGQKHGRGAHVRSGGERDEGEWEHGNRQAWAAPAPLQRIPQLQAPALQTLRKVKAVNAFAEAGAATSKSKKAASIFLASTRVAPTSQPEATTLGVISRGVYDPG